MRFNLKVPYAQKDQAKKLGARWDAARKIWYVDGQDDLTPFAAWSPTAHAEDGAGRGVAAPARVAAQGAAHAAGHRQSSSELFVGSRYVAPPNVCDCAPWEECERCRAYALAG